MNDGNKNPVPFDLDFDHTKTKKLDQKLFSGEISFEEWKSYLQDYADNRLSVLD